MFSLSEPCKVALFSQDVGASTWAWDAATSNLLRPHHQALTSTLFGCSFHVMRGIWLVNPSSTTSTAFTRHGSGVDLLEHYRCKDPRPNLDLCHRASLRLAAMSQLNTVIISRAEKNIFRISKLYQSWLVFFHYWTTTSVVLPAAWYNPKDIPSHLQVEDSSVTSEGMSFRVAYREFRHQYHWSIQ